MGWKLKGCRCPARTGLQLPTSTRRVARTLWEGEKDYENNIFHAGHVHVSETGLMIGVFFDGQ